MDKGLNLDKERNPMRVTDLMIGDWIQTPKGSMKIRAISQDGTVLCGSTTSPSDWEKFTEYEIRPTTIDLDTLERNGFVDCSTDPVFCKRELEDRENSLKIHLQDYPGDDWDWLCTVYLTRNPENPIPIIQLRISCMHELQHILQLVGFKITPVVRSISGYYD